MHEWVENKTAEGASGARHCSGCEKETLPQRPVIDCGESLGKVATTAAKLDATYDAEVYARSERAHKLVSNEHRVF